LFFTKADVIDIAQEIWRLKNTTSKDEFEKMFGRTKTECTGNGQMAEKVQKLSAKVQKLLWKTEQDNLQMAENGALRFYAPNRHHIQHRKLGEKSKTYYPRLAWDREDRERCFLDVVPFTEAEKERHYRMKCEMEAKRLQEEAPQRHTELHKRFQDEFRRNESGPSGETWEEFRVRRFQETRFLETRVNKKFEKARKNFETKNLDLDRRERIALKNSWEDEEKKLLEDIKDVEEQAAYLSMFHKMDEPTPTVLGKSKTVWGLQSNDSMSESSVSESQSGQKNQNEGPRKSKTVFGPTTTVFGLQSSESQSGQSGTRHNHPMPEMGEQSGQQSGRGVSRILTRMATRNSKAH
jgi:hypothetical protein